MFRVSSVLLIALAMAGAACDDNPNAPSPAQTQGTWSGTFESSNYQSRAVQVTLTQADTSINGSWSGGDWSGSITGTVDGNRASGTVTIRMPALVGECESSSAFGGNASSTTMTWSITRFEGQCDTPPAGARFVIQRR
ncbi:MAG: hypothetical protein AB7O67_11500 [Vicinamibacterales bacterium]